ncbi:hypothetical protein C2E23DRAFT_121755 [Lenzites betulinus]|nr:hypothetical protein C2E23DRAFT_121755 [Lenzites betulinus]
MGICAVKAEEVKGEAGVGDMSRRRALSIGCRAAACGFVVVTSVGSFCFASLALCSSVPILRSCSRARARTLGGVTHPPPSLCILLSPPASHLLPSSSSVTLCASGFSFACLPLPHARGCDVCMPAYLRTLPGCLRRAVCMSLPVATSVASIMTLMLQFTLVYGHGNVRLRLYMQSHACVSSRYPQYSSVRTLAYT